VSCVKILSIVKTNCQYFPREIVTAPFRDEYASILYSFPIIFLGEPSRRVMYTSLENDKLLKEDLNLIDETRNIARVIEMSWKQWVAHKYNMKIVKHKFEINNLVMRSASNGQKNARHGKLAVK
jgi:hypothetical protein